MRPEMHKTAVTTVSLKVSYPYIIKSIRKPAAVGIGYSNTFHGAFDGKRDFDFVTTLFADNKDGILWLSHVFNIKSH